MNYLARSRITCIDPFGGNVEHHINPYFAALALKSEAQFDANLDGARGPGREDQGQLGDGAAGARRCRRRFDLAYIDGSHVAADVYRDAALTWPLIEPGGWIMFDDYEWDGMEELLQRPKPGIDAFLAAVAGQYREVHRGYQLVIAKL